MEAIQMIQGCQDNQQLILDIRTHQEIIRKLIKSKRTGNKHYPSLIRLMSPLILPPYRYLHTTRLPFIHPAASHHMYIMGYPGQ